MRGNPLAWLLERRCSPLLGKMYSGRSFCSGMRCLLTVVATISVVEVAVMMVLPHVLPAGTWQLVEAIVDGVLLGLFSIIPLWLLLLGPLRYIAGESVLRYGNLVAQIQDGVFVIDKEGQIVSANPAAAALVRRPAHELVGSFLVEWVHPVVIPDENVEAKVHEGSLRTMDGERKAVEYSVSTLKFGSREELIYTVRDITPRKHAEAELKRAQQALVESSRLAGMSDVATTILHNVGNVLNSVNIAIDLLDERSHSSQIHMVTKTAELLDEHADDLASFMISPKGQALREFLRKLGKQLETDQDHANEELMRLKANIDHIKQIVQMQSVFTTSSGANQRCNLVDVVDDAVRINELALERHCIDLIREYETEVMAVTDHHKVTQVVVNLISNAKAALDSVPVGERVVRVAVRSVGDQAVVEVTDNGEGIDEEFLVQIFHHGFTTREDGHGFGLHSSAIAAQELGGTLEAASAGPGRGATFTLSLPRHVEEPVACPL